MKNNPVLKRRILLAALLLIGFGALEFPGIILVGEKIFPFILGLPHLYGYIYICWAYMCFVLYLGYRSKWGRKPFFSTSEEEPD